MTQEEEIQRREVISQFAIEGNEFTYWLIFALQRGTPQGWVQVGATRLKEWLWWHSVFFIFGDITDRIFM